MMQRRPENLAEARRHLAYIKAHHEELLALHRTRVAEAQSTFQHARAQHAALPLDLDSADAMDNYCASTQDLHSAAFDLYTALADDPLSLLREAKGYIERFSR